MIKLISKLGPGLLFAGAAIGVSFWFNLHEPVLILGGFDLGSFISKYF